MLQFNAYAFKIPNTSPFLITLTQVSVLYRRSF